MSDPDAAFRRALRVPFREDAGLIDDLAAEADPVIDALAFAIGAAGDDPAAIEFREALALGVLLGRRAALSCATPTLALSLADGIRAALEAAGSAPGAAVTEAIRAVLVEGYCAAIEERVRAEAAERAARSIAPERIAERCFALVVAGEQAAEPMRDALDRAARTLLDADARACLVHAAISAAPSEDLAAELFGFDATARMIGIETVFSGIDGRWLEAARARLDPSHLAIADGLEDGLRRTLEVGGARAREGAPLVERLRRLLARS